MGRNYGHQCLSCGKNITWQFAICSECERVHGSSPSTWPKWLSFLWRDEQRQRRQAKSVTSHEITASDIPGGMGEDTDYEEYSVPYD